MLRRPMRGRFYVVRTTWSSLQANWCISKRTTQHCLTSRAIILRIYVKCALDLRGKTLALSNLIKQWSCIETAARRRNYSRLRAALQAGELKPHWPYGRRSRQLPRMQCELQKAQAVYVRQAYENTTFTCEYVSDRGGGRHTEQRLLRLLRAKELIYCVSPDAGALPAPITR